MYVFYVCILAPLIQNGFSLIGEETDLSSLSSYEAIDDINENSEIWETQDDAGMVIFDSISRPVIEEICKDSNTLIYITQEDVTIDCKAFNNGGQPIDASNHFVKRSADDEFEGSGTTTFETPQEDQTEVNKQAEETASKDETDQIEPASTNQDLPVENSAVNKAENEISQMAQETVDPTESKDEKKEPEDQTNEEAGLTTQQTNQVADQETPTEDSDVKTKPEEKTNEETGLTNQVADQETPTEDSDVKKEPEEETNEEPAITTQQTNQVADQETPTEDSDVTKQPEAETNEKADEETGLTAQENNQGVDQEIPTDVKKEPEEKPNEETGLPTVETKKADQETPTDNSEVKDEPKEETNEKPNNEETGLVPEQTNQNQEDTAKETETDPKKQVERVGKTLIGGPHKEETNHIDSANDESVKTDESTQNPQKAGTKDTTILIVLFAAVVVVGALAFGYNYIKKRKQQSADLERVERGSLKRSFQNLAKTDSEPEKKPLMDEKDVEMVDMKKENSEKAPSETLRT